MARGVHHIVPRRQIMGIGLANAAVCAVALGARIGFHRVQSLGSDGRGGGVWCLLGLAGNEDENGSMVGGFSYPYWPGPGVSRFILV